ncbi:hypothetical protein R5R35_010211 [Gryllus longicercus]
MGYLVNNIRRRLNIYAGNTCLNIENRTEPVPVYSIRRNIPLSSVNNWSKKEIDVTRPKHHHQLAEDISPQQPFNTRLQAFKILVNSQLSDVVSCDYWSVFQKHLVESLCDPDAEIFKLSLTIHAKLLTLSYNIMREGFSSLIEGLRSHYSRKFHKFLPSFDRGLEFNNPVHHRIIKISHLILETTKLVPEHWVRMGEKAVEEIMNIFLAVISMHTFDSMNSKSVLYPFHVMATIDPKAKWCRIWLHCGFGRRVFMSQQSRVITLLRYVVEEISNYLPTKGEGKPTKPINFICKRSVRLSVFSHCVNILCCFATYKRGHSFFPLSCKIKNDPVTLSEMLCTLMNHLNGSKELNLLNFKIISDAMVALIQTKESPFLSLAEVFTVCLEPMKEVIDHPTEFSNHHIPWHTIDILEALSKNETGMMFLVEGKSNGEHKMISPWGKVHNTDIVPNFHPVNIIMDYTDILLRSRETSERALIPLLHVCTVFFKYYDLCSMSSKLSLIESSVIHFQYFQSQSKDIFHSKIEGSCVESEELKKSLINFLASVVSQPGGLLAVIQCGLNILDLVPLVFQNSFLLWESSEFRRLVSMFTVLQEVEDTMAIECTKPLSIVLCNLWTALEDEESFVRGIERNINTAIMHYMNVAHTFTCTLSGTKIFFSEYEGSEETLLENGYNPISPAELIMIEHSNDPWHKVALLTLQTVTRNLDAWLYVESKFNIEKRLVQVQLQNVTSPIFEKPSSGESDAKKNIIVDECSLLRHQILTKTHIISKLSQEAFSDFNTEILESFMSIQFPEQKTDVTGQVTYNLSGKSEFQRLLESSDEITNNTHWLICARKAFRSKQEDVIASSIVSLIKCVSQCNGELNTVFIWVNDTSILNHDICAEEMLGVKISVRYGVQIGLLEEELPNNHLLKELLQRTQTVLQIDKNSTLFRGFDWFISSVFLLCSGNLEECQTFLNNFVTLQVSLILWPSFAESRGVNHLCIVFSSLLEMVISENVPLASAALRATGIPWGVVCYSWLSQCFWTILKWNQVCEWLTLCILYPPDIIIYYCAALLHYLQPKILRAAVDEFTWDQLVHENFIGFSITDQMTFLDKLVKEHRTTVLPKLLRAVEIAQ